MMKRQLAIVMTVAVSLGLTVRGEFSKERLKRMQDTQIAGARVNSTSDENRNKVEALEINTFQNEDELTGYRIHIAVKLTDEKKLNYLAEFTADQPVRELSDYTGEDYWKLIIPHGDLKGLKILAYVVQYGAMDGAEFRVLAEKSKGAKTLDELKKQASTPFSGQLSLKNYYMYTDPTDGTTESDPTTVRPVKK